ncbi:MAG: zf-HC2 domain-containing protein [Deltaproteobacteria bacterium]|nr:zf-HC2 domain-containing protein [Deltaproteobacteria bacterium]
MECSPAKSLLSEYLDDTLAPQDRDAVSEHLQACAECRGELAALASLVHELGALDPVDPPRDFLAQVHDRLDARFSLKKLARMAFMPLRVKLPLQLASAVVLGGLAVLVVTTQWPGKPVTAPRKAVQETRAFEQEDAVRPLPAPRSAAPPVTAPRKAVQDMRAFEEKEAVRPLPVPRSAVSPATDRAAEPARVAKSVPRTPIQLALTIGSGEKKESLSHAPAQDLSAAQTAAPTQAAGREGVQRLREERSRLGATAGVHAKAKMKKQADASPVEAARLRIETLARQVGGRIISVGGDRPGGGTRFVIVSIPAAGFPDFLAEINRIGSVRGMLPEKPLDEDETVEVHIRLMLEP